MCDQQRDNSSDEGGERNRKKKSTNQKKRVLKKEIEDKRTTNAKEEAECDKLKRKNERLKAQIIKNMDHLNNEYRKGCISESSMSQWKEAQCQYADIFQNLSCSSQENGVTDPTAYSSNVASHKNGETTAPVGLFHGKAVTSSTAEGISCAAVSTTSSASQTATWDSGLQQANQNGDGVPTSSHSMLTAVTPTGTVVTTTQICPQGQSQLGTTQLQNSLPCLSQIQQMQNYDTPVSLAQANSFNPSVNMNGHNNSIVNDVNFVSHFDSCSDACTRNGSQPQQTQNSATPASLPQAGPNNHPAILNEYSNIMTEGTNVSLKVGNGGDIQSPQNGFRNAVDFQQPQVNSERPGQSYTTRVHNRQFTTATAQVPSHRGGNATIGGYNESLSCPGVNTVPNNSGGLYFAAVNAAQNSNAGQSFSGVNTIQNSSAGLFFSGVNTTQNNNAGLSFSGVNATQNSNVVLSFSGVNATQNSNADLSFSGVNATQNSNTGLSFSGVNATQNNNASLSFSGVNTGQNSNAGLSFSGVNATQNNNTGLSFSGVNTAQNSNAGLSFSGVNATQNNNAGLSFSGVNATQNNNTGLSFSGVNTAQNSNAGLSFSGVNATQNNNAGLSFSGVNATQNNNAGLSFSGVNATQNSNAGLSFSGVNTIQNNSAGLSFSGVNTAQNSNAGLSFSGVNATQKNNVGLSLREESLISSQTDSISSSQNSQISVSTISTELSADDKSFPDLFDLCVD